MKISKYVLALAALLTLPMTVSAVPLVVNGGWQTFDWNGIGAINQGQYSVTWGGSLPVTVQIVDCCLIGDEFRATFGPPPTPFNSSITALADDGVSSGAFDGDTAWGDKRLSHLEVFANIGNFTVDIETTRNAAGFTSGAGFIRAFAVPEPGTWALMALGLAGVGFVARRRAANA